ncbi:Elongator complex protein [Lachnellula hyalina]|uniref:Elongator complex protein n=1 Tax=Lachnellula hyalina TaxID=1316788 RepID=A0A8H8R8B9_9HELO|nr:Elongator complex protein [Lachnellula hyalina]TVY30346.1 Elongator complex protein [Lachnellula hyalina]
MASKVPPLLEPYLALPPEASLILLTSVLGASTNWLVLRFLHSALASPGDEDTKVVFVSFMRDLAFWKEGAKRLGLDLEKLAAKKRFKFMDGLSGLFVPEMQKAVVGKAGEKVLSIPALEHLSGEILEAVRNLKGDGGRILLVVDQLDLLLAAGGENIGAVGLGDMLMGFREEVYSTVTTLSADFPLVSAQQTPLEKDHAAFLLSVAHQADFTMGLRLLDTGTARDVSGVVRITVGDQFIEDNRDIQRRIEERELLYFVGGDGGVRVFERGQ